MFVSKKEYNKLKSELENITYKLQVCEEAYDSLAKEHMELTHELIELKEKKESSYFG